MSLTNAIKVTIFLGCFFSVLVSSAQTDTLYVLYENSEFSSKGSDRRVVDRSFKANYPLDKGRTYQYSIRNGVFTEEITFSYMNKYPSWSDRSISVIEMDVSGIKELPTHDNEWFANTGKSEIVGLFDARNTVIFLGDKERIKDNKIHFIRVYFNYWAEE